MTALQRSPGVKWGGARNPHPLLPARRKGLDDSQRWLGVAVVTNQSGLAWGYFDSATLDRIHAHLRELLADGGAFLDGI
jgi:histidinol phosphatase-like enzyme